MDEMQNPAGQSLVPVNPPDLDANQLVSLARELAMKVRDPNAVLAEFHISTAEFTQHVVKNAYFKRAYASEVIAWESATNANKRIAVKAGAGLEDGLLMLSKRMGSAKEKLSEAVEAGKLLAKLSGADAQHIRETNAGEKFTIQINLGENTLRFEETIGKGPSPAQIQPFEEGEIAHPEIQSLPQRTGTG